MNAPYRGDLAMPDPAETETAQRRKIEFASVFDNLVASNMALSKSVGSLVRLSWAIILLNVVLIGFVVVTLLRSHT